MDNNIINEIFEELSFQYRNNLFFYIKDEKSIDNTLNDYYKDWSPETNILIHTSSALDMMAKSCLHEFLSSKILDNSKDDSITHFLRASAYNYSSYQYRKQVNAAIESKIINPLDVDSKLYFSNAAMFLAQFQICRWWDKAKCLGNDILESINNCGPNSLEITDNGESVNPISWFIVDLFTIYTESWYIEKNAAHTAKKKYLPYQSILDNWDCTKLDEVDKMISILCELHLIGIENKNIIMKHMDNILRGSSDDAMEVINYLVNNSSYEDFAHRELEDISVQLLPYEVLAWLSIRTKFNLENPCEFTHPLMNTRFIKDFFIDDNQFPVLEHINYIITNARKVSPNLKIDLSFSS